MNKVAISLSAFLLSACTNIREFPYQMIENSNTVKLTIEDTYAPNFTGVPLFTRYFAEIRLYDSVQECPYLTSVSYNYAELPGYLGTLKINKEKPSVTVNINGTRPIYIDIYRQKDITNSSEWCTSSYRLDVQSGKSYHVEFDGRRCHSAFYELDSGSKNMLRIDVPQGGPGDERLCL